MSKNEHLTPVAFRARLSDVGVGLGDGRASGVADLGRNLNLNAIAIGLGLENIEYEPEQFPGLVYRHSDPAATVILFDFGTTAVPDAVTENDVRIALSEATTRLKELGLLDENIDPAVTVGDDIEIPVPAEFTAGTHGKHESSASGGTAEPSSSTEKTALEDS